MRAMSIILIAELFGDVAGVFVSPNNLVIIADCDESRVRVSADSVDISVVCVLIDALHWESEFLRPSGPFFILYC